MQVFVDFDDERISLNLAPDALLLDWHAPEGVVGPEARDLVAHAVATPDDYPPLRQAIVPGDRVVIALGIDVPEPSAVLGAVCETLKAAGVEPGSITIVAGAGASATLEAPDFPGIAYEVHDPNDRNRLAYLAASTSERRIYLNRSLIEADFVLPIGRLGYDPVLGYRGPWSLIFPDLSDQETRLAYQSAATSITMKAADEHPLFAESTEVSWLLGTQFQLGIVAGSKGIIAAVAGNGSAVIDRGSSEVDASWEVRVESRADLVIVGVGSAAKPSRFADVAQALATATDLVQRGGKIVVLSKSAVELGPAIGRLIAVDDPRRGPSALRGHERDSDYQAARKIAQAIAWADVYWFGSDRLDDLESLAIIAMERPEEVQRLAALSQTCLVVSQADQVSAAVADDSD